MPLVHDELLSFPGFGGVLSRCRIRLFVPPREARESGYVVLITDEQGSRGTSITNAAETVAALVCRRWNVPAERARFVEHYDFRHLPGGCDDLGRSEVFAQVEFSGANAATLARDLSPTLGRPGWRHTDRQTVEIWIGEPLP